MRLTGLILLTLATMLPSAQALAGSVEFEQPGREQIEIIQAALGEKYPISKAAAVKSYNHGKAYYVGAVFHAKGAGELTGVWFVSGDKQEPSSVYSIDGNAFYFSKLEKAVKTDANASKADPEARALKKYLEQ